MNEVWIASKVIMKTVNILVGKHEGNITESKRHLLEDDIKMIIKMTVSINIIISSDSRRFVNTETNPVCPHITTTFLV